MYRCVEKYTYIYINVQEKYTGMNVFRRGMLYAQVCRRGTPICIGLPERSNYMYAWVRRKGTPVCTGA